MSISNKDSYSNEVMDDSTFVVDLYFLYIERFQGAVFRIQTLLGALRSL